MEINMIQKLDEWYKEWRGVSHLEESNVQVLDSSEAQDFARYCIGEFQTLQASSDKSKLLLADVSKCNCQTHVKCDNCGEMVIKISTGEFCPSCYC